MNKIKIFSLLSLGVLFGMSMTSCEDILSENVNIDKAHTNTADQGLPVVVFYAQQTVYDHAEYNVFLSQALTTMGKAQVTGLPYRSGWEFLNINRQTNEVEDDDEKENVKPKDLNIEGVEELPASVESEFASSDGAVKSIDDELYGN